MAVGDLTERTMATVTHAVDEVLDEGVTALTVDLRQVAWADTEPVSQLVLAATRARERGVSIRVLAGPTTREALETATTLALFTAIDEALATVASMRALLEVCSTEAPEVPTAETVTWVSTDEPVPSPLSR